MAKIKGTQFDDTLDGTDATDRLYGLAGDDSCYNLGAGDTFYGGTGDDYANAISRAGETATAHLYGGQGDDQFSEGYVNSVSYGGEGDDYFSPNGGTHQIFGGAGTDTIQLSWITRPMNFTLNAAGKGKWVERVDSPNADSIVTYAEIEGIITGSADDTLTGNNADNFLYANYGADQVFGRGGHDVIYGAEGHDTLTGGRGRDAFAFNGNPLGLGDLSDSSDLITDFNAAADRLVFNDRYFTGLHTASDQPDATVAGEDIFAILPVEFAVQTTPFAATEGVRLIYDRDDGLLYYDADGALGGDDTQLIADIGAGHNLTAANFFVF